MDDAAKHANDSSLHGALHMVREKTVIVFTRGEDDVPDPWPVCVKVRPEVKGPELIQYLRDFSDVVASVL